MNRARITLVGDDPELSEQILRALLERGFEFRDIRALGGEDRRGEVIEVDEARLRVDRASEASLDGTDATLFFGDSALAQVLVPACPAGSLVLDGTWGAAARLGVTPVVPEVNAERIGALGRAGPIALASPATVGLAVALAPLHDASRVRRVVATVLRGASGAGRAGIERLSRQSVELMQGKSLDPQTDPEHLAFNLRPDQGDLGTPWSAGEVVLAQEIGAMFGEPRIEVVATGVRAPVFYGIAQSVYVETETPLDPDEAARSMLRGRGLLVAGSTAPDEGDAAAAGETPIAEVTDLAPGPVEVAGSDGVHVARLRGDPARPGALAFWLCLDDQYKGTAVNMVSALEVALRDVRS